jgi:RNA polymerase sigma-70 factor, ECF subfamily
MVADASSRVEAVFREEWGRIVASLIAMTGDWDLAEECAQDAFARAVQAWDRDGVPARPGAWLTTAARNRAVDVLRRRANETVKLQQALLLAPAQEPPAPPSLRTPIGQRSLGCTPSWPRSRRPRWSS